jgi:hypothetical protein
MGTNLFGSPCITAYFNYFLLNEGLTRIECCIWWLGAEVTRFINHDEGRVRQLQSRIDHDKLCISVLRKKEDKRFIQATCIAHLCSKLQVFTKLYADYIYLEKKVNCYTQVTSLLQCSVICKHDMCA